MFARHCIRFWTHVSFSELDSAPRFSSTSQIFVPMVQPCLSKPVWSRPFDGLSDLLDAGVLNDLALSRTKLENEWMSFAKAAVQEGWIEALGCTGP